MPRILPTSTYDQNQYYLRPGENVQAYNSRVRQLYTSPAPPTPTTNQAGMAQGQTSGIDTFNQAVMGLMRQYQQLGTKPFKEQELNASDAQLGRVSAETPQSLIGANPNIQSGVRNASAGALDPLISGARSSQQTFGEQINSFGQVLETARQFSRDYEAKQQSSKTEARQNLLLAVELGGAAGLESIKKENPNIFKIAGLDEETLIESAKAKESYDQSLKKTVSYVDAGDHIQIRDNQGNLVGTIKKGATPKDPSSAESKAEREEKEAADELNNLLLQYREGLNASSTFGRLTPFSGQSIALKNLQGQITAVYKKKEKLGTLDAGVQKLIDSIIPGVGFNFAQLNKEAQIAAIDNFVANQGGTAPTTPSPSGTSGVTPAGRKFKILP